MKDVDGKAITIEDKDKSIKRYLFNKKKAPRISPGCPVRASPSCLDHCFKAGLEFHREMVIIDCDPLDQSASIVLVIFFNLS